MRHSAMPVSRSASAESACDSLALLLAGNAFSSSCLSTLPAYAVHIAGYHGQDQLGLDICTALDAACTDQWRESQDGAGEGMKSQSSIPKK